MREAVGSTWVYGLVITFTFIFAGFLTLVIAYSRAYKIKNEVTLIVEKYEGLTLGDNNSGNIISNYLTNSGYSTLGNCKSNDYGLTKENEWEKVNNTGKKYILCITNNISNKNYTITAFYNFNLPIVGNIITFSISGDTNTMIHTDWPTP